MLEFTYITAFTSLRAIWPHSTNGRHFSKEAVEENLIFMYDNAKSCKAKILAYWFLEDENIY